MLQRFYMNIYYAFKEFVLQYLGSTTLYNDITYVHLFHLDFAIRNQIMQMMVYVCVS